MALDVGKIINAYKKAKSSGGGGGGVKREDLIELTDSPEGNQMRLVPFKTANGKEELFVETKVHFLGDGAPIWCRDSIGEPCPACEYQKAAKARKIKAVADQIYPRERIYYNAVVRDPSGKFVVKTLEAGKKVHLGILALFANEDYGNIADPRTGNNIKIFKEGSGLKTVYRVEPRPQKTPCPQFEGTPVDFTKLLDEIPSYEETEAALYRVFAPFESDGEAHGGSEEGAASSFDPEAAETEAPKTGAPADDGWAEETFGPAERPAPAAKKPTPAKKPMPKKK